MAQKWEFSHFFMNYLSVHQGGCLKFDQRLESGVLIKRYKRFLADIEIINDKGLPETLTIHCPNTGAMTGCNIPGSQVWFSASDNPKRKYPNTWEILQTAEGHKACVNTLRANKLVEEAIVDHKIHELNGYASLAREVRYGEEKSRIDLFLSDHSADEPPCYIEVKSVTLLMDEAFVGKPHVGMFPDAVSTRGQKHLRELITMKEAGFRSVLLFCVNHTGIEEVRPADHVDPNYGRLLRLAAEKGVEIFAYGSEMSKSEITITGAIPVDLSEIGQLF